MADTTSPLIRLGLPKGSLQEATQRFFAKAGWKITYSSRSYKPFIDDADVECRLIRAQEMSRYIEAGFFDVGLTGYDWVLENGSDVVTVTDLIYSRASSTKARWVIAVPEDSKIQSIQDLQGKHVATEVVNLTRNYLEKHGVEAKIEFSWGATEVKVPDLVDAIVDLTETGNSLRANRLRILDTILTTQTQMLANKQSWNNPLKRKKIESIAMMLQGALAAESKVGLKLNCQKDKLEGLLSELPSLNNPTVSHLSVEDWVAVEAIIEEKIVRELIPTLKLHGAQGIIEYPLNKVVP